MVEKISAVIVDSYAIMADFSGQIPFRALKVLDSIRTGTLDGIVHYLIIYELAYHWRRGRLPFKNEEELIEFVKIYFKVAELDVNIAASASQVKIRGDRILREATDDTLKHRRLSIADATTIVLALKFRIPIVTGDKDLSYVAKRSGVKVIW